MKSDTVIDIAYNHTEEAISVWDKLRALPESDKWQLLFDTSTFECNKPLIMWMFSRIAPSIIEWDNLDTRSDRRENILFKPGTMIQFNAFHDSHDYPVPSIAMIYGVEDKQNRHGKKYMKAIREDGRMGSLLYVYNPFEPAFSPVSLTKSQIQSWIKNAGDVAQNARPSYRGTFNSYIESIIHRATNE